MKLCQILFYKNYTDIKGLINVKNVDSDMIYNTPNTEIFGSTNLLDYISKKTNYLYDRENVSSYFYRTNEFNIYGDLKIYSWYNISHPEEYYQ